MKALVLGEHRLLLCWEMNRDDFSLLGKMFYSAFRNFLGNFLHGGMQETHHREQDDF